MLSHVYQNLIKPLAADTKTLVLDTLFPIECLRCGVEGVFVCSGCLLQLSRLKEQYCIVCQKPSIGGLTHPYCKTPHGADGLISLLNYHDEAVANIIIKGKYSWLPDVYRILGKMLANHLSTNYPLLTTNYSLIPLPLHSRRRRWRGFNQAEILCEAINQELGIPIVNALIRTKSTKTQKDLKRDQRIKNMKEPFTLQSPLLFKEGCPANREGVVGVYDSIRGKNLILVDDVTTTGSTLLEAAKVLKRNGASKVLCLTVARD